MSIRARIPGLGVTVALLLGGVSAARAQSTVVSLSFDDAYADQRTAHTLLAGHGMRATFYIVSSFVGRDADHLTADDLRRFAADGHEIGGHTVTHADLTTLSTADATREVCDDRAALQALGFTPITFAYPYGAFNATVERIVADCGYDAARAVGGIACSGCAKAETIPPYDPYALRTPALGSRSPTLAELQALVTGAENAGGGWVPIGLHHVCDNCGTYSISPGLLGQFLDWLAARSAQGTVVRTVADVMGRGAPPPPEEPPPPPPPNPIANPSLELDANGNRVPDCWTPSGSGVNRYRFARISGGHTGSWAERVDVTKYTSGIRVLLPTLDNGPCAAPVSGGTSYVLGAWYKSTASAQLVVRYLDGQGVWQQLAISRSFAAAASWTEARFTTPPLPSGARRIAFGLGLTSKGTLTTDDYSLSTAP